MGATKTISIEEYNDLIRCRNLVNSFRKMLSDSGTSFNVPESKTKRETLAEGAERYRLKRLEKEQKKFDDGKNRKA